MKRQLAIVLSLLLMMSALVACADKKQTPDSESSFVPPTSVSQGNATETERTSFHIAGLKGPTTMGMVKLMNDAENGETRHDYIVETFGAADEVNTRLIQGEMDVAMVPANVASVLYNKTGGKIQVAAINTLGVLYVLDTSGEVKTVEDLKGKTIYTTGKGQTPEFVLNYILRENGIDPMNDVNIEFKSEAPEVAGLINQGEASVVVLPQPFATAVQIQNEDVKVALDLTEEWDKISSDSSLVTGVLVARTEFIEENKEAFAEFLEDYSASIEWVNANNAEAAELIAKYGIVEAAPVAQKALPYCNITYVAGEQMKTDLSGYLAVLYEQNPEAIGGEEPDDDFYFVQ